MFQIQDIYMGLIRLSYPRAHVISSMMCSGVIYYSTILSIKIH